MPKQRPKAPQSKSSGTANPKSKIAYGHKPKLTLKSPKRKIFEQKYLIVGILCLIVIVLITGGISESSKIETKYHKIRYGMDARHAFSAEFNELSEPLMTFGVTKNPDSSCSTESYYGYSTPQLQCDVEEQPYVVIGNTQTAKAHFVAEAGSLDKLLREYGWTENQNATPSYQLWMQGITAGKDWYPDEGAYKNIGNVHCWMDSFIAYANPSPPAFSLHIGCDAPALQRFLTLPF